MTVLYVAATEEEAAQLPAHEELLITGLGTLAAAITLIRYLYSHPDITGVVNFGTAGQLNDASEPGIYQIDRVVKHDFDAKILWEITGKDVRNMAEVLTLPGVLPVARLATGDSFISDSTTRARLAEIADLVDMEGYAIAMVCRELEIPCVLVKQISDSADETAASTWAGAVATGAGDLAEAALAMGKALELYA